MVALNVEQNELCTSTNQEHLFNMRKRYSCESLESLIMVEVKEGASNKEEPPLSSLEIFEVVYLIREDSSLRIGSALLFFLTFELFLHTSLF